MRGTELVKMDDDFAFDGGGDTVWREPPMEPPSPDPEPQAARVSAPPVPAAHEVYPAFMPQQALAVGHDVMPQQGAHMLGLSLLLVATGAAVGAHYGGLVGAGAGGLLGGAVLNLFRASRYWTAACQDESLCDANKREARVSATYAVIGAGIGAYIVWRMRTRAPSYATNSGNKRTLNACNVRPVDEAA